MSGGVGSRVDGTGRAPPSGLCGVTGVVVAVPAFCIVEFPFFQVAVLVFGRVLLLLPRMVRLDRSW